MRQRVALGLDPAIELGSARQPEAVEKGSRVQRDRTLQIARAAPLVKLRDVTVDDSGVESQLPAATDRVGATEVAAKHVDRLAQDAASACLVGVGPQKREQPLSRHTAPARARQHPEDRLTSGLCGRAGKRHAILLDGQPA